MVSAFRWFRSHRLGGIFSVCTRCHGFVLNDIGDIDTPARPFVYITASAITRHGVYIPIVAAVCAVKT